MSRVCVDSPFDMEAIMDAVTQIPAPRNEPVHSYAPGSSERAALEASGRCWPTGGRAGSTGSSS
jgi:hypothetical protein